MLGFKKRPIENNNLPQEKVKKKYETKSKKRLAKDLLEIEPSDVPEAKHRNTCQTDLLDELSQQLSECTLSPDYTNAAISPCKIIGQFYQKVAQSGSLGTLRKMEEIAREEALRALNAHKGWALGMAVVEKNTPVVMHILSHPGNMLHLGHVKYAIDKANQTQQLDLVGILEEFKQRVILTETTQRRVNC